jgi:endonuclease/exonuclease/phosphatase family metal-dependent hydrolase
MPDDINLPPADVAQCLLTFQRALDHNIPAKAIDRNLLIATWNIRAFGGLTELWRAGDDDSPARDLLALRCIADVIARFDVIAVQEAKGNIKALRHMMKLLGPDWGFIMTDVTKGRPGNDERMAFIFDLRRVRPSGLAGELVVPPRPELNELGEEVLVPGEQFARTPYAVSFYAAGHTFILVTLHVIYGKDQAERIRELNLLAEWLADWATEMNAWGHNLIVLGDFNIDRRGDPAWQAFTSRGLTAPAELNEVPRTIFQDPDEEKFYDQIAWFTDPTGKPRLSLRFGHNAGGFDFVNIVENFYSPKPTRVKLSWKISDHYPLWAEFSTRADD